MSDIHFALVGSGGLAREVMCWARACVKSTLGTEAIEFCFAQSEPPETDVVNGLPCVTIDHFAHLPGTKYFNIAFTDSAARQRVSLELLNIARPLSLIAPNAMIGWHNEFAEGAIICPFSCIEANVKIGRFFHANVYSYVAHDCVIGNFVTFAPKVCCNGGIHIGDHAYIGAGAVIKQSSKTKPLTIGDGALVGMGAVVTKTVEPNATVVGNPARSVSRTVADSSHSDATNRS